MKVKVKKEKKKKVRDSDNPVVKFWDWLWHSDSILSWVVALALAFVTVKFIFFPLLSLIMGTQLPLVVVESSSMEHPGSFVGNVIGTESSVEVWWKQMGGWYESRDISIADAKEWPLRTGFDKGDIMVVWGRFEPEVGDVIIFNANTQHPIIHRVVNIKDDETIETKGDNNNAQLPMEKNIQEDAIIGKAVFRIPKIGWLKLVFVELFGVFS